MADDLETDRLRVKFPPSADSQLTDATNASSIATK